ncbi:DUF6701 domain-containing protein [Psychromonas hadalis]|uniref:DUF6701 domain-containing protein n=1 Tax=Psychromonas hadalis TaxID=211669 RepID=UPI0003B4B43D|nr:DUF6701 domain-containing protein [Psychromonas hadalis]
MKQLFVTSLFFLLFFSVNVQAVCEAPANLADYQVIEGNYNLNGKPNFSSPGIYVKGDVFIPWFYTFTGNIYATGNVTLGWFSSVDGSVYAESSIFLGLFSRIFGDSCTSVIPSAENYCANPPDVSNYKLYEGNLFVSKNSIKPNSGREDIYVTGRVSLNVNARYNGNIYSVGDVYLNNNAIINGNVYSQSGVIERNHNSDVVGKTCEYGDPVAPPSGSVPIDLPVDELIEECNDIFPDAVQSFNSRGNIYMQNDTQILNSLTNRFSFYSEEGESGGDLHNNSCGNGAKCQIKIPSSKILSSFFIPNISGDSIALWQGESITIGGSGEYSQTTYKDVTAGQGSTITFLRKNFAQDEMYQIDRLTAQGGSTIRLEEGVYAIRELTLNGGSKLEVIGSGNVMFFIQQGAYGNPLNLQGEIDSGSGKFYFTANGEASFNSRSSINASIYINGDLTLDNNIIINGQTASSNLKIRGNSKVYDVRMCGAPPVDDNQFVIITQPNALTCEPHPVTLKVLKSNGDPNRDYVGVVNLTATSTLAPTVGDTIGDWSMVSDNKRLDNLTANDGIATYTFDGREKGQIALLLAIRSATDVSVLMSQGALASDLKPISFHTSLIKTELSCVKRVNGYCINTANKPFSLTLSAVKENEETRLCEAYNPEKIAFWSQYVNPVAAEVASTSVYIESAPLLLQPIGKADTNTTEIAVTFVGGIAKVKANYPDAGAIEIHVKDTGNSAIIGQADLIVNPLKLVIDDITEQPRNLETNRPKSSGAFIRASVPDRNDLQVDTFDLTAKAIIDCTASGVATNCPSVADDVYKIVPSFSHNATLTPSAISDYLLGTLDYENSLTVLLTAGKFTYQDLAYSEVGMVGLQLENENYLITGNNVDVDPIKELGHFYPDYLTYSDYSYDAGCTSSNFTYFYQEPSILKPDLTINYTLHALAQVNDGEPSSRTENYDHSRGYPVANNNQFLDKLFSKKGSDLSSRLTPLTYYDEENWADGNYFVTNLQMGLMKASSIDGPFFEVMPDGSDNQLEYFIHLVGSDGEKLQTDAVTVCGTGDGCLLIDPDPDKLQSFGDFAYGRLKAENGHGSEYTSLRAPIKATYFDGNGFSVFKRDSCTPLNFPQIATDPARVNKKITISNAGKTGITTISIAGDNTVLQEGLGYLNFSAPVDDDDKKNGVRGKATYYVEYQSIAPWLLDETNKVKCKGANCLSNSVAHYISGQIQFGLFRGNDRIIYRKQTFD